MPVVAEAERTRENERHDRDDGGKILD